MKDALSGVSIGVLISVALLSANGWLSYLNTRLLDENARLVIHTQEVLDSLTELENLAMDGVATYRHYLITGDDQVMQAMGKAFTDADAELGNLAQLTEDNPAQQAQLPKVAAELARVRDRVSQTALVRKLDGFDAAREVVLQGEGLAAVASLKKELQLMEEHEAGLLKLRNAESRRSYRVAVVTGAIATAAGLAVVALLGWIVRRFIASQNVYLGELDHERQLLQATLQGIGDAVIATDAQCRVTFMNPIAEALTGWRQQEASGHHLDEVFHIVNEETRELVTNPAARALQDGRIVGLANHTVLIGKDGVERTIDDSAAPIRDLAGRLSGAVLVFRDVSERRHADRALAERAKLAAFELEMAGALAGSATLDSMLQQTADVLVRHLEGTFARVWTLDERSNVLELRASAGQYAETDDSHGRIPVGEGHKIGVIALHRRPTLINRVVGDPRVQYQEWAAEQRIVAFAGYPLLVEDRVVGVIGMFSRTALSEATLNVMSIVATTIALAIERIRSEEALRDANRRKDEFLAMLGHELRNPLAGIVTGVDVLKMLDKNPETAEMQEVIDRQAAHMSHIVDDLLDVSRIARGKLGLRKSLFELRELVRHTVEDYTNGYTLYDCEVDFDLPDEEVWVDGDRTRLAQVLTNLIHNGCKFCDGPNHVGSRLEIDRDQRVARLIVTDKGIGMSDETLRRVFEPFHQADTSLDRSRGGLGLGLAVVKGIVDLHGGNVCAHSEGLGAGTRVTITLPLAEKPTDAPAQQADIITPPRKVLLIDDRRDAIIPVQKMLSLDGHEVTTANDGPSGLDRAREFRPDVILCDIGLAGSMNGYDVARAVRSDPELSGIYMVAVTGYGQEEDRRTAQTAGFDYHVTKPVSRDQLRQLMGRMPRFEA